MLCTKHAWNTFSGEMIQDGKEHSNPCAGRECSHGGLFLCRVTGSFESLKYRALLSCPLFVKGALCEMKVNTKNLRGSCHLCISLLKVLCEDENSYRLSAFIV